MNSDTAEEIYEHIYHKTSFDEILNKDHCLPQLDTNTKNAHSQLVTRINVRWFM
jgi:hypothetical protein